MARRINLDELRAKRPASQREPRTVVFGGEEFTMPASWPILAIQAARENRLADLVRHLLGTEPERDGNGKIVRPSQADRFLAHDPSEDDLAALIDAINGISKSDESETPTPDDSVSLS